MGIKTQKGFSLIELIITIAIIAILATIAIPVYQEHVTKTRRLDATTALLDLANRMERYYAQHQTYATATLETGNPVTDILTDAISPQDWYQLSITENSNTTYTIQATPQAQQGEADQACQSFTLTHLGEKGITAGPSGMPSDEANRCWR